MSLEAKKALSEQQKEAIKRALKELTAKVANNMIAKAQQKGQESGACSVMGELGLGARWYFACVRIAAE